MRVSTLAVALLLMVNVARGDDPAVERGRDALTRHGYLKASWSDKAYKKVGALWGAGAPIPTEIQRVTCKRSVSVTACTRLPIPTTDCRWVCGVASRRRASNQG